MNNTNDPESSNRNKMESVNERQDAQLVGDSDEWLQLQQDWQTYQPDIERIKKKIAWVTWRMVFILALDVLIMIAYVPFLFYWVIPTDAPLIYKIWSYAMLPIGVFGVFLDFRLRLPVLRLEEGSTQDILKSYLKLVEAGVQVGLWSYRITLALLILFLIWTGVIHYSIPPEEILLKPALFYSISVTLAIVVAIMYWYSRKKLKEQQNLTALWKEFIS